MKIAHPQASPGKSWPADRIDGFRRAMRLHAAGVCLLTIGAGEAVNGMAATAVTSFSMEPPSILACVNHTASIANELVDGQMFGVTVLGRKHQEVVEIFSRKPTGRARFSHPGWRLEPNQLPWLEDAVANIFCVVDGHLDYGTHRGVIGRVVDVKIGPEGPSLIYRDGAFLF